MQQNEVEWDCRLFAREDFRTDEAVRIKVVR